MLQKVGIAIILVILFTLVQWPVLSVILNWTADPRSYLIIINSIFNSMHLFFWVAFGILEENLGNQARRFDHYTVIGGTALLVASFTCSSCLLMYFLKSDDILFFMETFYFIITSTVMNYSMVVPIFLCFSKIVDTSELRPKTKKLIFQAAWTILALALFLLLSLNLFLSEHSKECVALQSLWQKLDFKYIPIMGFLLLGIWDDFPPRGWKRYLWALGAFLVAVSFHANTFWVLHEGFAALLAVRISDCSRFMLATSMQLILESFFGIVGLLAYIFMVFGLGIAALLIVCYGMAWILCPRCLEFVDSFFQHQHNQQAVNEIELPLLHIHTSHFDPQQHTTSFRKEGLCVVCLEHFEEGQDVVYWPQCRHVFHKNCIENWIRRKRTCPTCKRVYQQDQEMQPMQAIQVVQAIQEA